MAITKDYIDANNNSELVVWMQTNLMPDYFADITYSPGTGEIICTDENGNTIFFSGGVMRAYKSEDNAVQFTNTTSHISYACKCTNGALLTGDSYGYPFVLLFTKTNNGKTAIAFSTSTSGSQVGAKDTKCVAWGDVIPDTSLTFNPTNKNQTQLIQFTTDAALGTVSYTPNAFYIPAGQTYGIDLGTIIFDGHYYLTNGYWAIKDDPV